MKFLIKFLQQLLNLYSKKDAGNSTNSINESNSQVVEDLPIAGLKDDELEQEFKKLGQVAIGNSFTIDRVIITASQWGINKDLNGRPVARSMITCAIGKSDDKQCYKQVMTFTQNVKNGSYGSTFYDASWSYPKSKIICPDDN